MLIWQFFAYVAKHFHWWGLSATSINLCSDPFFTAFIPWEIFGSEYNKSSLFSNCGYGRSSAWLCGCAFRHIENCVSADVCFCSSPEQDSCSIISSDLSTFFCRFQSDYPLILVKMNISLLLIVIPCLFLFVDNLELGLWYLQRHNHMLVPCLTVGSWHFTEFDLMRFALCLHGSFLIEFWWNYFGLLLAICFLVSTSTPSAKSWMACIGPLIAAQSGPSSVYSLTI